MREKGFAMVLCLLMLLVVTLLGIAGMQTATFGIMASGNGLEGQKAFWIAESGLQDSKEKLNQASGVSEFLSMTDYLDHNIQYGEGSYIVSSVIDPSYSNRVSITSVGSIDGKASKKVACTLVKFYFDMPAAIYSEALLKIHGSSVFIDGGTKYGIATTLPQTVDGKESVILDGAKPEDIQGAGLSPSIHYNHSDMSIKEYVDFLKGYETFPVPSGTIWGSAADPCVVYKAGEKVTVSGPLTGNGILMVDGNLDVHGGIDWTGLIIVSGTISFAGGGSDSVNITGSIMSGEIVNVGTDMSNFGGSMVITFQDLSSLLKENLGTVRMVSWKEVKN